jgi:hypothetical protein
MTGSSQQHGKLRALVETNFTTAGAGIDLLVLAKHMTEVGISAGSQRLSAARSVESHAAIDPKANFDGRGSAQDHAEALGSDLEAIRTIKHMMELNEGAHDRTIDGSFGVTQDAIAKSLQLLEQLPTHWVMTSADRSVVELRHGGADRVMNLSDSPGIVSLQAWAPSQGNRTGEPVSTRPSSVGTNDTATSHAADRAGGHEGAHNLDARSHSHDYATTIQNSSQDAISTAPAKAVAASDTIQTNLTISESIRTAAASGAIQHAAAADSIHSSSQYGRDGESTGIPAHAVPGPAVTTTLDLGSPLALDPVPLGDVATRDDASVGISGPNDTSWAIQAWPASSSAALAPSFAHPATTAPAIPDVHTGNR